MPGKLSTAWYISNNGWWSVFRFGQTFGWMHDGRLQRRQRAVSFPPSGTYWPRGLPNHSDTFEVGHFSDGFYFLENTFLASADNELSLMSRDGTESTSAKASPVDVDRELDHFISRNSLVFVFRMRKTGVRQVERHVQLSLRHGRIRRVGNHRLLSYLLKDAGSRIAVGFFLNMSEVLCLFFLVLQAFFMRIECQVALPVRIFRQSGYLFL